MVNRCICHDVPFQRVAQLSREGLTLDAIRERTGCGTGCGMCEPYLRVVCATGRTAVPVLTPAQAAAVMARPLPAPAAAARAVHGDGDARGG